MMRTALVTGASRGLGRAFALALARDGYALSLAARDAAALAEVAREARAAGAPEVLIHAADLSDPEAPAAAVAATRAATGGLHALINNAGATKRGDFLSLSESDFLEGFALKFHATVRFCRAGWQALSEAQGSIVNISGVGAHTPEPDFTIGGSVNAALINFGKAISQRAKGTGLRVNTVCPGHIVTDRLAKRIGTLAASRGLTLEAAREEMRRELGIARFGTPEDVAEVVRFLCSPAAAYIHGTVIDVDGGATPGI